MRRKGVDEHTVEIWVKGRFVGNGAVIMNPDGTRKLVTAKHVVFKEFNAQEVEIRPRVSRWDISRRVRFNGVPDRDLAEISLPKGRGIPLGTSVDVSHPVRVIGSVRGKPHDIRMRPKFIGGKPVDRVDQPEVELDGTVIHYDEGSSGERTFPGTSGSVIANSRKQAIGIHVGTQTLGTGFHAKFIRGLGEMFGKKRK